MGKLGRKIRKRDARGWLIPRDGTMRRRVYDLLVTHKNLGFIQKTLGISYAGAVMHKRCIVKSDRVNALKYNLEHPEVPVRVPGDDIARFRRALMEIEKNSTDQNSVSVAREALGSDHA